MSVSATQGGHNKVI